MKPIILILFLNALTLTMSPLTPYLTSYAGALPDTSKVDQVAEKQTSEVKKPATRCDAKKAESSQLPDSFAGPRLSGKNTSNLIIIL